MLLTAIERNASTLEDPFKLEKKAPKLKSISLILFVKLVLSDFTKKEEVVKFTGIVYLFCTFDRA